MEDLNHVAFHSFERDAKLALEQCQRKLQGLAEQVVQAADASRSATLRSRIKLGGISGASALAIGFVGTILSGGALPVAGAVAGAGFAVGGLAGAASVSPTTPAESYSLLIDVWKASGSRASVPME